MTPVETLFQVLEGQDMGINVIVNTPEDGNVIAADYVNGDWVIRPEWLEKIAALNAPAPDSKKGAKS